MIPSSGRESYRCTGRIVTPIRRLAIYGAIAAWLVVPIATTEPSYAGNANEYFFFPAAGYSVRSADPPGDHDKQYGRVELDFFFTADINNTRVLAEIFGAVDEGQELEIERLQLSWKTSLRTRTWIGRFHNPLGAWNTQYHHGAFLQTSISRPGIIEFEDDGGVLPLHLLGVLLEGHGTPWSPDVHYDIGLGAGPEMDDGLEAVEPLQPGTGSHDLALATRLYWTSPEEPGDQIGIFAALTRIPGHDPTPADITQRVAGVFVHWGVTPQVRTIAEWFAVNNELTDSGISREGSFGSGYLQLEYTRQAPWTLYGRIEETINATDDPYLDLFGDFLRERRLFGIRYDIANNQSIKAEIARLHFLGDKYSNAIVQWSAVYP